MCRASKCTTGFLCSGREPSTPPDDCPEPLSITFVTQTQARADSTKPAFSTSRQPNRAASGGRPTHNFLHSPHIQCGVERGTGPVIEA